MIDERTLFDRFHAALDIEPRPGAYEQLRFEITEPPVALKRPQAFHMRWPKMGLRLAAATVAVVITIALVAAFIAAHQRPVGYVPAGPDSNLKVYQAMMRSDYANMDASTSGHCQTIQDTGCADAVKPVVAALQKWVDDLTVFHTPSQYAVLDGVLRNHLGEAVKDLNAAVAAQKANDTAGFDLAMNAALYERSWIDPASFALEGTDQSFARSFSDAVSKTKRSLDSCVGPQPGPAERACSFLARGQSCAAAQRQLCTAYEQGVATDLESFLVALQQQPGPNRVTTLDVRVQSDLANADGDLLALMDSLLSGDSSRANDAENLFNIDIGVADSDVDTLAGS